MRKVTLAELKELALAAKKNLWEKAHAMGRDVKLYLHWSAGHYDSFFDDYHVNIAKDGSVFVTTDDLSEVLPHTWRRNSGAVGISLACCAGATSNDLGDEPPTEAQIASMAQVIAILTDALDLTIDINRVMTHGEAADNLDGEAITEPYGPDNGCERWDLAILKNGDEWKSGGDIMRGKANWYAVRGEQQCLK